MIPSIPDRVRSDRSAWASEVAADPAVLDTETETLYGDSVKQGETHSGRIERGTQDLASHAVPSPAESAREMCARGARWSEIVAAHPDPGWLGKNLTEEARLAWLARVQYVDPRERRL